MIRIELKRTAIAITQRCTLRCRLCNAYMPYYDHPIDMPFDQAAKALDRYFAIVDSVGIFSVLGGEPLMHRDLYKVLMKIHSHTDQIRERIDLVTNGTMDMNDEVFSFFMEHAPKAKVIISHYGKHSAKADALGEKLAAHGANHRIAKYYGDDLLYGGWIDYRDHSVKHTTPEAIEQQAKHCIVRQEQYYLISEGQMHTCTRAHWRMRQGIIPRNPREYLDLLDDTISIEQHKMNLHEMDRRSSTTSCAYCEGASHQSKRYEPAEQLERSITRPRKRCECP